MSGLGDNIERYDEMFESLKTQGIKTIGMDLRGFGRTFELQNEDLANGYVRFDRSPIQKGYTQFAQVFKDILELDIILKTREPEDTPTFLFGHSMGGLIAVYHLAHPLVILLTNKRKHDSTTRCNSSIPRNRNDQTHPTTHPQFVRHGLGLSGCWSVYPVE
jgi:pimeloyl-ACP methyl ester carboxylesterase